MSTDEPGLFGGEKPLPLEKFLMEILCPRDEKERGDFVSEELKKIDPVNHPPHYTFGNIEPIDVIEDWDLGFHLGNALTYIARARHKGSEKQDLDKALWYINRYIALQGYGQLK